MSRAYFEYGSEQSPTRETIEVGKNEKLVDLLLQRCLELNLPFPLLTVVWTGSNNNGRAIHLYEDGTVKGVITGMEVTI